MTITDNTLLIYSITLIIYAILIMWMLLDIKLTDLSKRRKLLGILCLVALLLGNVFISQMMDITFYTKYYFFISQLPVFLLFRIISNYKNIKLFFVLLTTVFLCAPIIIVSTIMRKFFVPSLWLYLCCYAAMSIFVYVFLKKPFNNILKYADDKIFGLFLTIPLLFYIYNYALTQYQFYSMQINAEYFIRQIPFLIAFASYILLIYIFKMLFEKQELQNDKNIAAMQLSAASEQIEALKDAHKQSAIYRHDLRHHLTYINSCISQDKLEDASSYINEIVSELENHSILCYTENESINLILSAYVTKAQKDQIKTDIIISTTDFSKFAISDLCSLLSNAIENAIFAAKKIDTIENRYINLHIFDKNRKLCIDIQNSYATEPIWDNNFPMTTEQEHGIGTKSMAYVVTKYHGWFQFTSQNGVFIFQAYM